MEQTVRQQLSDYIVAHQEEFYRLAYSYVKNRDAALDVVQDTVVNAMTHAASLKSEDAVKPWVYRILVNESLGYLRRSKRLVLMEETPEEVVYQEDVGERLDLCRAVDRLEPKLRTVVMLRFYEDMKLEDIARITGANVNTVKSRLYKALEKLKKDIGCEIG